MPVVNNKKVIFSAVPQGLPQWGKDYKLEEEELDTDKVALNGGILAKLKVFSFDPYMRGRMRAGGKSYVDPFPMGQPLDNFGVGEVVRSETDKFPVGSLVYGNFPLSNYAVIPGSQLGRLSPLDNKYNLPLSYFVGPVGMPGQTAFMGLRDCMGQLKSGAKIYVNAAAGAVGQMVCQLAKRAGVKVFASAGDDAKVEFLTKELGVERAVNYKKVDINEELAKFAGDDGIEYMWDNVGGDQLDAYFPNAADHGIIAGCGTISGYNDEPVPIRNYGYVVSRKLTYKGFIVLELFPKYMTEFSETVPKWVADGEIKAKVHEFKGIENSGEAFQSLFTGRNFGKVVLSLE